MSVRGLARAFANVASFERIRKKIPYLCGQSAFGDSEVEVSGRGLVVISLTMRYHEYRIFG